MIFNRFFKQSNMIPVLCYHSMRVDGNDYHNNDHIALEKDLQTLAEQGYRPISAADLLSFLTRKKKFKADDKVFVLTFDDAPILDWDTYQHPTLGKIKSFRHILEDSTLFADKSVPTVSFAIASEEARTELDRTCMQGNGDWQSDWWVDSINSGLFEIANHSLDHLHFTLAKPAHSRGEQGDFYCVDNYQDADIQIRQAQQTLNQLTNGKAAPYFAYPYGHASDYLVNDYFPNYQHEHGTQMAFTTEPRRVKLGDSLWKLPRFVCGQDWKSPKEFISKCLS